MFLLLLSVFLRFFVADGFPFSPFSALKDCPHIPPQENLQIEKIAGSWRLGYLYYDDKEDFEEDGTCVVTEFTQLSDSQMDIVIHFDVRDDDYVVDRSTFNLLATFHSPGEWLLHSNLSKKAYVHVRVISLTKHHLILTFCISNVTDTRSFENREGNDFAGSYIFQAMKGGTKDGFFRKIAWKPNSDDETYNELEALFGDRRKLRRKRNSLEEKLGANLFYNNLKIDRGHRKEKHFWTIILVRDNNISPLNFVENASFLMKLGFDITEGNLVSFGKCGV